MVFRENQKKRIRHPDVDSNQNTIFFVFYIIKCFCIILKHNETIRNSMNFYKDKIFYFFQK